MRVGNISDPQRAIGAITCGRVVLFGFAGCHRLSSSQATRKRRVLPQRLRLAGEQISNPELGLVAVLEFDGDLRVGFHVLQLQDDADRRRRFHFCDGRLAFWRTNRSARFRLPAIGADELVVIAKTIALAADDVGAGDRRLAGPVAEGDVVVAKLQEDRDALLAGRRFFRPIKKWEAAAGCRAKTTMTKIKMRRSQGREFVSWPDCDKAI